MEEVQITPSGFKRLVQEDLTRQNKVPDEVIDFHLERKESLREVVERKFVEGREDETIKKAASEYKKAATEYKERDTANTAAIFGSGERIYNQSKKEGKGIQEDKKRVEGTRIPRLKRFIEVTRIPRIKKTIKVTHIPRIERAIEVTDFPKSKAKVEDGAGRKEYNLRSTAAKGQQKAVRLNKQEVSWEDPIKNQDHQVSERIQTDMSTVNNVTTHHDQKQKFIADMPKVINAVKPHEKINRLKSTCNIFFFLSGFSFMDTDNSQDSRGREGIFVYSSLPLPPAHEHSDIYLQLCT